MLNKSEIPGQGDPKINAIDELKNPENINEVTEWFIKEAGKITDDPEYLDSITIKKVVADLLDVLAEKVGKEGMKGNGEQYIEAPDEYEWRIEYWNGDEKLTESEAAECDASDITEYHWDLKLMGEVIADCYRGEYHDSPVIYIKSWNKDGIHKAMQKWMDLLKNNFEYTNTKDRANARSFILLQNT